MVKVEQCCFSVFCVILFTINVITVGLPQRSQEDLSRLLKGHHPLIVILTPSDNHKSHHTLRTTDEKAMLMNHQSHVVEIDKARSNFKFNKIKKAQIFKEWTGPKSFMRKKSSEGNNERSKGESYVKKLTKAQKAMGRLLKILQVKNNPLVKKLKNKVSALKDKFRNPLRFGCSSKKSCKKRQRKKKRFRQKSIEEVDEHLSDNLPHTNTSGECIKYVNELENEGNSDGRGSTMMGPQSAEPEKAPTSKECANKPSKYRYI